MAKKRKPPTPHVGRPTNEPDLSTEEGRFGAALRALRIATKLSVIEAARRCGVQTVSWYGWELGTSWPRITRLRTIARTLRCDLDDLIPEED